MHFCLRQTTTEVLMIITLSGPSGIGKGYLTQELVAAFEAHVMPWATTRRHRPGEAEAKERIFLSREGFATLEAKGELIGVQRLHQASYGLPISHLEGSDESIRICEVNTEHAANILPLLGRRFSLAMICDDFGFLRERIINRDPDITTKELNGRLEQAEVETRTILSHTDLFDLVITITRETQITIVSEIIERIRKEL